MNETQYDFVIIGSGFGGSVCAMRLAQKGYNVAVLESGKRWHPEDFPETNWNFRKYFWLPLLRCFGIQRITLLKGLMVLHGTGVGGGSLVYANTLVKPPSEFFEAGSWPRLADWKSELEPYYKIARKMLGVTQNTAVLDGEKALRQIAMRMGIAETFHTTEVGVFFGEPGVSVADPYFQGAGPGRTGCTLCGGCMIGCRHKAKNSLDQNYLYFAERWGVKVFPETEVVKIKRTNNTYELETRQTTSLLRKQPIKYFATNVIVAAGVLGTVELLFKCRDVYRTLPDLSPRLGEDVRTNGESLSGVTGFDSAADFSRGVAIGAAIHPDGNTKIESVRYPSGSGAMKLLGVPMTGNAPRFIRPLKMIFNLLRRFPRVLKLWFVRDWARNSLILLVMQSVDLKMRLRLGRPARKLFRWSLQGKADGRSIPSYSPVAQKALAALADEMKGEPQNIISEVLLGIPATAHILGGCCMGNNREEGVINIDHEVFGYPGLYVCDGSIVPANPGVNPSLTITAMSERFCNQFSPKDEETYRSRQINFTSEREK